MKVPDDSMPRILVTAPVRLQPLDANTCSACAAHIFRSASASLCALRSQPLIAARDKMTLAMASVRIGPHPMFTSGSIQRAGGTRNQADGETRRAVTARGIQERTATVNSTSFALGIGAPGAR